MTWEKGEIGEVVNPVGRARVYGGNLDEEVIFGSQNGKTDGLFSFDITTSQNEAEQVLNK